MSCPLCKARFYIRNELAGRKVHCPECNRLVEASFQDGIILNKTKKKDLFQLHQRAVIGTAILAIAGAFYMAYFPDLTQSIPGLAIVVIGVCIGGCAFLFKSKGWPIAIYCSIVTIVSVVSGVYFNRVLLDQDKHRHLSSHEQILANANKGPSDTVDPKTGERIRITPVSPPKSVFHKVAQRFSQATTDKKIKYLMAAYKIEPSGSSNNITDEELIHFKKHILPIFKRAQTEKVTLDDFKGTSSPGLAAFLKKHPPKEQISDFTTVTVTRINKNGDTISMARHSGSVSDLTSKMEFSVKTVLSDEKLWVCLLVGIIISWVMLIPDSSYLRPKRKIKFEPKS